MRRFGAHGLDKAGLNIFSIVFDTSQVRPPLEIPVVTIAINVKAIINEIVVEVVGAQHAAMLKAIPNVELENRLRKCAVTLDFGCGLQTGRDPLSGRLAEDPRVTREKTGVRDSGVNISHAARGLTTPTSATAECGALAAEQPWQRESKRRRIGVPRPAIAGTDG